MQDDRDIIDQIKESVDIVSVIERSVKLKKAGKNYSGLCPFHNEKTPSFIVSPDIQRYKCYGCGNGGDVFNFVQEIENIDFFEAKKKLAEEAGIKLEERKKNPRIQKIEDLNELANTFFSKELKNNPTVLKYLHDRGITDKSIEKFDIGFSGSYNALLNFTTSKTKYSNQELLDSGLFTEKEGKVRDRFIKRVMFPIKSVGGKIIAYSGRQLPGDDFGPKYLNTPETPVFHKRDTLFGIFEGKNDIRKEKFCIMCEGQTDVIAAHAIGITNIIAPLGTALTESQVQLIQRYAENIHFVFDSDTAGQAAVERGFKIAAELGVNTYAVSPEPYKDIDEVIQADPEMAKKITRPKVDAFSFLIHSHLVERDLGDQKDYIFITNYAKDLLSNVKSPTLKEFYLKKFNNLTGIQLYLSTDGISSDKPTTATKSVENTGNTYKLPQKEKTLLSTKHESSKSAQFFRSNTEFNFLALVIKYNEIQVLSDIDIKYFKDESAIELIEYLKKSGEIRHKEILVSEDLSGRSRKIFEEIEFNLGELMEITGEVSDYLKVIYNRIKSEYYARSLESLKFLQRQAEEMGNEEDANKYAKEVQEILIASEKRIKY